MANILDMLKDFLSGSNQAKTTNTKPYDRDKRTYTQSTKASNDVARKQPQVEAKKREQELYNDTIFSKGLEGEAKRQADYNANLYKRNNEEAYAKTGDLKAYNDYLKEMQDIEKMSQQKANDYLVYRNAEDNSFLQREFDAVKKTLVNTAKGVVDAVGSTSEFFDENMADYWERNREHLKSQGRTDEEIDVAIDQWRNRYDVNDENSVINKMSNSLAKESEKLNTQIYAGTKGASQFAMQVADSVTNMYGNILMGSLVGVNPVAIMGGVAGASKTMDMMKSGKSVNESVTNGLLTASLTAISEKMSLDNLTDIAFSKTGQVGLGAIIAAVGSQSISEALEEGLEYSGEIVIDNVVPQLFSKAEQDIATIIENSISGIAHDYKFGELLMSMALGLASGGVSGSFQSANVSIKTRSQYEQLKQETDVITSLIDSGTLPQEELNNALAYRQSAINMINAFNQQSVLGDSVRIIPNESKLTLGSIEANLQTAMQSDVQAEQLRQAELDLENRMQKILNIDNINMLDVRDLSSLTPETINNMKKIAAMSAKAKQKVLFVPSLGPNVSGFNLDDLAVINPNSKDAQQEVMTHEVFHSLNDSDKAELIKIAKDDYQALFKEGTTYDERLQQIKDLYAKTQTDSQGNIVREGKIISDEEAMEELTAFEIQKALGNDAFINKLANYNSSLSYRIFTKIKNSFNQSDDFVKRIENKFLDAYRKRDTITMADGTVAYNIATYDQGGREALIDFLDKNVKRKPNDISGPISPETRDAILSQMDAIYDFAKKLMNNDNAYFSNWSNVRSRRYITDDQGNEVEGFSVIVANGEYKMNIDFSTVCKKRENLDIILNFLVSEGYLNHKMLEASDINMINKIIKDNGLEIACALCFVDSKRYRQGIWAQSFADDYNGLVKSLTKGKEGINIDEIVSGTFAQESDNRTIRKVDNPTTNLLSDMDDSELDFSTLDKIIEDGTTIDEKGKTSKTQLAKMAETIKNNPEFRKYINPAELLSSDGLESFKYKPELHKLIHPYQGTAKPKSSFRASPYSNEIALSNFNSEKAFMLGGVRIQSFSDYQANLFFDYCQMISELAALNSPAQSYTKELPFIKLFGLTGVKINMSLVPRVKNFTEAEEQRLKQLGFDEFIKYISSPRRQAPLKITPEQKQLVEQFGFDTIEGMGVFNFRQLVEFSRFNKEAKEKDEKFLEYRETAGLDDDGHLIVIESYGEDGEVKHTETFPLDEAYKYQNDKEYSKNCGSVMIGVSDTQIWLMLNGNSKTKLRNGEVVDFDVPFIIPYHKSSLNHLVASLRSIDGYKDYTDFQNTRDSQGNKLKNGDGFEFYKELIDYHKQLEAQGIDINTIHKDDGIFPPRVIANKYLDLCESKGWLPKFDQFAYATEDKSVRTRDYYKLLVDFSTYDSDGFYSEQKAVELKMPENYQEIIKESLQDQTKLQTKASNVNMTIVNEIIGALNLNEARSTQPINVNGFTRANISGSSSITSLTSYDHNANPRGIKIGKKGKTTFYSISDSDGNELSPQQQEYFKDSKVRDENGNLQVAYHGSPQYGFTVFDNQFSDDKLSFFFTNNYEMAQTYVNDDNKAYKVYLNLTNPLIANAGGRGWKSIRLQENFDPIVAKAERLVDLTKKYNFDADLADIRESLGSLVDGVEYMFQDIIENSDDEEIGIYTEQEQEELRTLAKELDETYYDWDADEHLDEYEDPMSLADYIYENQSQTYSTRELAQYAKNNGYDGVIVKDVKDNGKYYRQRGVISTGDVYIAFDSNQIKNVDNKKPTNNLDIRYSISDISETVQSISEDQKNRLNQIQRKVGEIIDSYNGSITSKDIESNQELLEMLNEVDSISTSLGETFNDNSEARKQIRDDIFQRYINEQFVGKNQDKIVDIILGPPGSGKSSVIAKRLLKEHNAIEMDSDIVKEMTPEFINFGGIYANAVHEESSYMAEHIRDYALENNYNIVMPLVGKNTKKIINLINKLNEKGYTINVYDVSLPTDKSIVRAMSRFAHTGRYLPINYLKSVGDLPDKTYDAVKHLEGVNEYAKYSNDVEYGQKAINLEQGRNRNIQKTLRGDERNGKEAQGTRLDGVRPRRSDNVRHQSSINNEQANNGLFLYDQALENYGAFEQGENPVRDIQVPQATDNGKTNRFARTIAESGSVDDDQVELLKGKIGEGDFSYTPVSNDKLIENANFKFDKLGVDEMYRSFMESDDLTPQNIANGEILLHNLASVKDNQKALSVASKLAHMLTEAGRAVQSARILKKLTPEGKLMHLERTINSIQKTINQRFGDKAPTIEVSEELKNKLLNASSEQEVNQVLEEISVEIAQQIPSTFMDKMNAWRYLAMLGNPRTHIRNIVGNAVFYPLVTIKNSIGTIIESVVAKNKGLETKTKAFINKNNADDAKLIEFATQQYDEYKNQLSGKKYDLKDLVGKNQDIFNTKLLNQAAKLNSDLMQKEDIFFSKKRFIQTLASYMKANGMTEANVDSSKMIKAIEYAREESLKQTYQDYNKFANRLEQMRKDGGLTKIALDAIVPFTKTPMNVLARGIDYSPLGLMKAVTYDAMQLKQGKITTTQMIDNLSAGLTGVGVAMLGYIFAMMGWFRTRDDDKDRKQYYDEDLGEQDYALVFPSGTYTIDWASPAIMPFAIGAELFNNVGAFTDGNQIVEIAAKILEPMFETSMLSGLASSVKSYSSDTKGVFNTILTNMSNYVSQYIPTLFGQIARTIDDTRRTTYPNKGVIDKTIKKNANKIPFASMTSEPYINRHGEEEKQEDLGMGMMGRLLLNTLSPGYYKSNKVTEYDEELYRLYKQTGEMSVIPSNSTTSITYEGEKYELHNEEFTNYQKGRYAKENEYVNAFIDSEAYNNYTDVERSKIIGKMREFAGMQQKNEYLQSIGKANDDSEYLNIQDALNNDLELHEYLLAKDYANNIKGDNAKSQYIDYLNDSDFSFEAKNYLYDMKYGKSKFNDRIESIQKEYDLSDEQALSMKFASSAEGVRKEDGSLVANSKALEVRQKYEELGTYDEVIDYIEKNGLQPKDVGLTKSVLNMSQEQFKNKYIEVFSKK